MLLYTMHPNGRLPAIEMRWRKGLLLCSILAAGVVVALCTPIAGVMNIHESFNFPSSLRGRVRPVPAGEHPGRPKLSTGLLRSTADNGLVVLTIADWNRRDFVENWVLSLKKTGCTSFIVGASDDKLLEWLLARHIPSFYVDVGSRRSQKQMYWGSDSFLNLMTARISVDLEILRRGFSVLSSDGDVVWMRNPIPFLQKFPEADILYTSDQPTSTAQGEELEHWPESGWAANAGLKLFRRGAQPFVKRWLEEMRTRKNGEHDQIIFDRLIFENATEISSDSRGIFLGMRGGVKAGALPVTLFCSGQTYKERLHEAVDVKPYALHATYQACSEAKVHRLREYGLWHIDREQLAPGNNVAIEPATDPRFNHSVGFLSYLPSREPSLLETAADVPHGSSLGHAMPHLRLVNHQLSQLRNQLVLAQALGGLAAVLPPLVAGADYYYRPHDGRVPGSKLKLPFAVPADQIVDVRELGQRLPDGWRETGFLEQDAAAYLHHSTLTVRVDDQDGEEGTGPPTVRNNTVVIRPERTVEQLNNLLRPLLKEFKVVHVANGMDRLITLSPEETKTYSRLLGPVMSVHCCIDHQLGGHIPYDLFWDAPSPHYDRRGKLVRGSWKPVPEEWTSVCV